MAAIAKSGTPRPCSDVSQHNKLTLIAGEAIAAGDAVYIKSDGKFWLASGASAAAAADFFGLATTDAPVGEACTAAFGCRFYYGSGQTPGALAYLSPTVAGGLDTANATITKPIGRFVDATRLQVFGPFDERTAA
jgi:hypothetical protein